MLRKLKVSSTSTNHRNLFLKNPRTQRRSSVQLQFSAQNLAVLHSEGLQQCPLLALSVCGPQMGENVCLCVCMRACVRACMCVHACVHVCGWNELEVCTTLANAHISSFRTMPVYYSVRSTPAHATSNHLRIAT